MDKTYKGLKVIFFTYIIVIAFRSFYPSPLETPTSDKLNHFIAFFILAVLYRISFQGSYWANFFIAIVYGALIELANPFYPIGMQNMQIL